jgi:hypothetical protein
MTPRGSAVSPGSALAINVPELVLAPETVLVDLRASLLSVNTERA